ncbi:MAG: AMP-binding protein [Porticoccaceae bacterium]|nr:AMP-binding protein [Porticoccaceae bacterium]
MDTALEVNLIRRIAMGDTLRRRATSHGGSEALVEFVDGERVATTYASLNQRVNRLVRGLRQRGVQQGDRVAILGANTSQMISALLGCFKGGFVAVPINFTQNLGDVEYNIEHSGSVAIFFDEALQPLVDEICAKIDRSFLLISLAGEARGDVVTFETLLSEQDSGEVEDIIIEDDDLAEIMYTSGTTARPKGVMLSHKNLFIATLNTTISIGANKDSISHAAVLPLFHIAAQIFALVSLHLGSKVVLQNGFEPATLLGLIESEKLKFALLLPLMWKAMLDCPELHQHDYSSLQLAMYGMAPMDTASLVTLHKIFGCPFSTGSGQTEITGLATMMEPCREAFKEGNVWGNGTVTSDQAVMDDYGNILQVGEIGEVVWRSPQVMFAYYNNPEASRAVQTFGWHHSGDTGYLDDDLNFCFIDRKKDTIKSGGESVSSVKVESCILNYGGIANVAVIGLAHEYWGEAVTAVVSGMADAQLEEQAIISHCKQTLSGFENPKRVIILEQLPMTATGKVKKHLLRQEYANLFKSN